MFPLFQFLAKSLRKLSMNGFTVFLISQQLMIPNQFGFRKGHSTSNALNFYINHIQEVLREKQHVLGIFIDLSKAFFHD